MKIKQQNVIDSVKNALQYISYYHSKDFIDAMYQAYCKEQNQAAKNAMAQILINSKMAAIGHRPICQDTGMVNAFVEVGMGVVWQGDLTLQEMINEGVRQAYTQRDNVLRASMVADVLFARHNTKDNTPAVVHISLVPGNSVDFYLAAKGAGSENKAKFSVLNPGDSLVDWLLDVIPKMGAGWCPPGIISVGVGGSCEKAMLLAKRGLFEQIDIDSIIASGGRNNIEKLRLELYNKINALGIGAQGLGGLTTVLDVKLNDYPTHSASLPVAVIPNCAATRHIHFSLDGNGITKLPEIDIDAYPKLEMDYSSYKKVNLDTLDKTQTNTWRIGETLLLSGTILTARDAAHKRLQAILQRGESLPAGVDFNNRFIYYVGPVDAVGDEVIGPAGPTTATRMDKFSKTILAGANIIGMIGKAERGSETITLLKRYRAVYLIAVGGAAYLIAKAIKQSKVVAFAEMGMEAIYQLTVKDMPVTVAVDSEGNSIHQTPQHIELKSFAPPCS